ncbi:MAG: hypothetical protein QJR03_14265 [Sphaerobacter sp.]|nr:hypothetical protein [Sphaerobacter sp.]
MARRTRTPDAGLHIVSFDLVRKFPAPPAWQRLAATYGVQAVWLVDDGQVTSSYHHPADRAIYVNTRGTCWYQTALAYGVERYVEAVTLWFLHELGHAAHRHAGADRRTVRFGDHDPREVQAWHFALAFRAGRRGEWRQLVDAYAAWYAGYRHRRKDWPDNLAEARAAGWPARPHRGWPAVLIHPVPLNSTTAPA